MLNKGITNQISVIFIQETNLIPNKLIYCMKTLIKVFCNQTCHSLFSPIHLK